MSIAELGPPTDLERIILQIAHASGGLYRIKDSHGIETENRAACRRLVQRGFAQLFMDDAHGECARINSAGRRWMMKEGLLRDHPKNERGA